MYDLLFLFIFIFIVINHIITLKQTHFFFAYFLEHALLSLTGKKKSAICLAERSTILAVFVLCSQYLYSLTK